MQVDIQSVGFTASTQLQEYVEGKLSKLLRFEDSIDRADVCLRLESGQTTRKSAQVTLRLKGGDLFATKQSERFEEAVDESLEALRRQLLKRKGKQRD